jgi:hypothetical protein
MLLVKNPFWTRQKRWAESLAERAKRVVPEGVKAHVSGWHPGCEPLFQFRDLEWVNIVVRLPSGVSVSRQYNYPQAPTDEQIRQNAQGLLDGVRAFTAGT